MSFGYLNLQPLTVQHYLLDERLVISEILKIGFLVDHHYKTLVKILCSPQDYMDFLNFTQGENEHKMGINKSEN